VVFRKVIFFCGGLTNDGYGKLVEKYLTTTSLGEARARVAWLIQWLCAGGGISGCMHGGGSPDVAKLMVCVAAKWNEYIGYACRLAGVK